MIRTAAKSAYASPNRGLALLDEAIGQIESGKDWNQGQWRCQTGMCVAGWVAQLAGGKWATRADDWYSYALIAEPEDQEGVITLEPDGILPSYGRKVVGAMYRATRLLGPDLTEDDCGRLFAGDNGVDDIRAIRDGIAERLGVA